MYAGGGGSQYYTVNDLGLIVAALCMTVSGGPRSCKVYTSIISDPLYLLQLLTVSFLMRNIILNNKRPSVGAMRVFSGSDVWYNLQQCVIWKVE